MQPALEEGDLIVVGGEDRLMECFQFHVPKAADSSVVVDVPFEERVFVNIEVFCSAVNAPALGAELDEFGFGFGGMHKERVSVGLLRRLTEDEDEACGCTEKSVLSPYVKADAKMRLAENCWTSKTYVKMSLGVL
jgi:hypothetical protein